MLNHLKQPCLQGSLSLWFLTKVISALLLLLNKKALMVSILWMEVVVRDFIPAVCHRASFPWRGKTCSVCSSRTLLKWSLQWPFLPPRVMSSRLCLLLPLWMRHPKMCSLSWSGTGLCCYQLSAVADLDLRFICVNLGLSSGSSIWLKSQQHPITPFSFPAF